MARPGGHSDGPETRLLLPPLGSPRESTSDKDTAEIRVEPTLFDYLTYANRATYVPRARACVCVGALAAITVVCADAR